MCQHCQDRVGNAQFADQVVTTHGTLGVASDSPACARHRVKTDQPSPFD
jgi:hypothetical protein